MAERNSHVINWDDAMEQCGDDEEFLRELLVDLKGEVEQQLDKIEDNIKNPNDQPFHKIMRAAHVIKGAAANLMCQPLRETSYALESAGRSGNDIDTSDSAAFEAALEDIEVKFKALQNATKDFVKFLKEIKVDM